jgi:SAM-dependent methyltransferase
MSKIFLHKYFNFQLKDTYNQTIKKWGFTTSSVCWSSKKSQYIRFRTITNLLKRFSKKPKLKVADIGCGCGELLNYFNNEKKRYFYKGYDINKKFINYCKQKFCRNNFYVDSFPVTICDVSIMNGTYNYAVTDDLDSWESYIMYNLSKCLQKSNLGIVFNLQFSSKRMIRNNIYYTEVEFMFNYLKKNFQIIEKFYSVDSPNDIYFLVFKG